MILPYTSPNRNLLRHPASRSVPNENRHAAGPRAGGTLECGGLTPLFGGQTEQAVADWLAKLPIGRRRQRRHESGDKSQHSKGAVGYSTVSPARCR
jgi:hypothetical protein